MRMQLKISVILSLVFSTQVYAQEICNSYIDNSKTKIKNLILILQEPNKDPLFADIGGLVLQEINQKEIEQVLTYHHTKNCVKEDKLVVYSYSFDLKFRNNSITSSDKKIYVNNKPLFLYNVNYMDKKGKIKTEKIPMHEKGIPMDN